MEDHRTKADQFQKLDSQHGERVGKGDKGPGRSA